MLNKVGKFDAKQDDIRTWFSKYELYSRMLGWTDEQRVDSLSFFLTYGLFRVVQIEEMTSFNEIKNRLFKFIDDLLFVTRDTSICSHIGQMIPKLDKFKFSKPEQRYWMNFIYQKENIREYCETISKNEDDLNYNYKRIMRELLA